MSHKYPIMTAMLNIITTQLMIAIANDADDSYQHVNFAAIEGHLEHLRHKSLPRSKHPWESFWKWLIGNSKQRLQNKHFLHAQGNKSSPPPVLQRCAIQNYPSSLH